MSQPNLVPNKITPLKFEAKKSLLDVLRPKKIKKELKSKKSSWFSDALKVVIAALIIAFVIRTFFLQISYIPNNSMKTTVSAGDWVIVNKLIYGIRDPLRKTNYTEKLPGSLSGLSRKPKRMDIVMFKGPIKHDELMGRIIGLPGERIKIKKGFVYINGRKINEKHTVIQDRSGFDQIKIPAYSYFILGDNRAASSDSRHLGTVPLNNLIGTLSARVWPLNKVRTFK